MSGDIEFHVNRATPAELILHLTLSDSGFIPALSNRVDISVYVNKLADKAKRFEAWSGSELLGLVAVYCNEVENRIAYITSVSVLPQWQGNGIAGQLMARCIEHMYQHAIENIDLEVDQFNFPAIALYKKYGFSSVSSGSRSLLMRLGLRR